MSYAYASPSPLQRPDLNLVKTLALPDFMIQLEGQPEAVMLTEFFELNSHISAFEALDMINDLLRRGRHELDAGNGDVEVVTLVSVSVWRNAEEAHAYADAFNVNLDEHKVIA